MPDRTDRPAPEDLPAPAPSRRDGPTARPRAHASIVRGRGQDQPTPAATRRPARVSSAFQVKIGIRNMVMPSARMQKIVVMKFTAPQDGTQAG